MTNTTEAHLISKNKVLKTQVFLGLKASILKMQKEDPQLWRNC
jgi:hypothetical protein